MLNEFYSEWVKRVTKKKFKIVSDLFANHFYKSIESLKFLIVTKKVSFVYSNFFYTRKRCPILGFETFGI